MRPFYPLAVLCVAAAPLPALGEDPAPVVIDASAFENLQAALDAVPDSGGLVKLPPGTFDLARPLVVSTPETRLEGAGASTHLHNTNESGEPALVIQPRDRATDPKARLWRVQLGNFRLSGNEKSGDGVHAEGINEIFVHGLSVDHHGGHGIALIDCYEDPRVADSILTYNKQAGLHLRGCHDIVVNGNHFEENQDAVQCLDGFNLCMNGNNLDDHLGHGVVIENTYGSVVSGNMIEECQGIAIVLDRDCYGITLSSNVIAHDMEGGIDLRDAHGCAVSANTFTLVHHFSVRAAAASGRLAITGNAFGNSHIGDGQEKRKLTDDNPLQIDMGTGVVLEGAGHVNVSGNTFTGIHGPAVRATGEAKSLLVTGNLVTDFKRDGNDATPAFDLPESDGNVVANNLVD
ncbi:MAG: right-handed parallel beta-helix repeat-containing protein [Verrucomicrobiae bacterium]|nr:right-handed parallel beta-helix repeat-containing protein [Verrucomicrobiae bacterium]MCP5540530.1 right-handed parallel beta-helix repeat-containing protein [Akkermansiaceae bacterium]MCP5550794.1 right-handed parallel beta-helix repeat-containing protein [Akkermansiaceae bacterium]